MSLQARRRRRSSDEVRVRVARDNHDDAEGQDWECIVGSGPRPEGEPEPEGTSEPAAEGTPEPAAEGTPEPAAEGTPEPGAEPTPERKHLEPSVHSVWPTWFQLVTMALRIFFCFLLAQTKQQSVAVFD